VCIDTVLAEQWGTHLKDAKYPPEMYHTSEGKFSCYIDAVEWKIGPSSYVGQDKMVALTDKWELDKDIVEKFKGF
jgi:hypothetical protein